VRATGPEEQRRPRQRPGGGKIQGTLTMQDYCNSSNAKNEAMKNANLRRKIGGAVSMDGDKKALRRLTALVGGGYLRARTADLRVAGAPLSQLSKAPGQINDRMQGKRDGSRCCRGI